MKSRLKKLICIILTLMFLVSCLSINAIAATFTKTVSVQDVYTAIAPYSALDGSINNKIIMAPATKAYNQDGFTGTLNKTSNIIGTKTRTNIAVPGGPTGEYLWQCTVTIIYTGTVSKYLAPKTVSYSIVSTVYAPESYINTRVSDALASPPSRTFNYDDGQYKGVLTYSYASAGSITNTNQRLNGYYGEYIYKCTISYNYRGTVEAYKP